MPITVKNSTSQSAELSIYEDIGFWGISARDFKDTLGTLKGKHVTLRIHSLGGDVLEGNAIYNAIRRHEGGVTVQIDGIAASMASVIAMAGSPVQMAENGFLMIHNPWSFAVGDAEEMERSAELLQKMTDGLIAIYAARTGLEDDELREMMATETWLTAAEAKEKGFIDEITDRLEIAASLDRKKLARFFNVPRGLVDTARMNMPPTKPKSTKAPNARAKGSDDPDKTEEPTAEEQIKELESRIAELEEELAKANEEKEEAEEAKAESEEEEKEAMASLARATKARDQLTAKLNKANETLAANAIRIADLETAQADFDTKVAAAAARVIASNGHRSVDTNPAGGGGNSNALFGRERTAAAFRKQFNK